MNSPPPNSVPNAMESVCPNQLAELTPQQQRELLAKLLREKAEREKTVPMSAGQQGLWHAFRRDPKATSFNVYLPTRLRSQLDLAALRRAIELLTERHQCLRATFSDAGGELVQHFNDVLPPEFTVHEMLGADEQAVRAAIMQETLRPFDLETGSMLRLHVYKLADDDWIVLALTHHILVDFWSLMLILNELRATYPVLAAGQSPSLPPPQNNYAKFVRDSARMLAGEQGTKQQAYWAREVGLAASVLELPSDKLRPAAFTGRAAVAPIEFSAEIRASTQRTNIAAQVQRLANQIGVTPVAVLQSALQVLLGRYSGQQDFFIGSPFSGRGQREYEQTVGFFVNMLPVRADLSGDPSFVELVRRTSQTLVNALEHESYPISSIVHDVKLPRDPSRSPLFQVSCTFEKSQVREEVGRAGFLFPNRQQSREFGGMREESFYVPHQTCHYDLEFIFEHTDSDLLGMICYCRDLFDQDSMVHMAKNFASLLNELLQNPADRLSRIGWGNVVRRLPIRDRVAASRFAESSPVDDATSSSLTAWLLETAKQQPDAIALESPDSSVTYGELMKQAQVVAQQLKAARTRLPQVGRAPQSKNDDWLVPVVMRRGPDAFIAILGTQLAGGVPVPIDADQPAVDCASLLDDIGSPIVFADASAERWLSPDALVVPFATAGDANNLSSEQAPSSGFSEKLPPPEHLAYIIYTSGSTGRPKGVMVEHRAVCNTLQWRSDAVPLEPSDRVLMLLSHQFDAGLGVAWTTLTQGATLVWPNARASGGNVDALIEQIGERRVSIVPAVPSLIRLLVLHADFAKCQSLRELWTGGESTPSDLPALVRQMSAKRASSTGPIRYWNFYGPTEAAIEAAACEISEHDASRPIPIGRPIANTSLMVVDQRLRPQPTGVVGELAISGRGLARGYLNNPTLTAERFCPHPYELGQRIYLTGDMARIRADGQLEFLGRRDQQVKLRGYRIELGEIETLLGTHPAIERATVCVSDNGLPTAQLHAYVALQDQSSLPETTAISPAASSSDSTTSAELLRWLRERVAAYKVPATLTVLDQLPVTSSGKVDRKRLPSPQRCNVSDVPLAAPRTEIERVVAQVWCEVLKVERVDCFVNFFDAGGSSLGAALLTQRLSERLQVHVPSALAFDLASVATMSTRLVEIYERPLAEQFGAEQVAHQQQLGLANTGSSVPSNSDQGGALPTTDASQSLHPLLSPLKPSGSKRPIFLVHPPGGIVVCYRELAGLLSAEQPLFGIRSRGLHGQEALPESMAEMASEYWQAIRSRQAHGPYIVGGWSLGGLVAYEVAQQILLAGEQVERLILLDTSIPDTATELVPLADRAQVGLEYGIDLSLDELSELSPQEQLPFLWQHAQRLGVLQDDTPAEVVERMLADLQVLFHHHVMLSRAYRMEPLPVSALVVRPKDVPFAQPTCSADRGWSHLVKHVDLRHVSGHHHSMVQLPHVKELAAHLEL